MRLSATTFCLPYGEWRKLSRRAYRAQQTNQREVCGLVTVDSRNRLLLVFMSNQRPGPGGFELDGMELKLARRAARTRGVRPIGYFHSHPISEAIPGEADLKGSPLNAVILIHDVCGINARLWRAIRKKGKVVAVELPLKISRSLPSTQCGD